jgi:N-acetylglucosaminyldiphosphoundecaprenol N-acetyl-beta-D-mannosaminyltransferase
MHNPHTPDQLDVLGIPVTPLRSYDDAVRRVLANVRRGEKTFCVAINPEKILRARRDEMLRRLIRGAELQICDGVGAAIAARLLHGRRVGRITGVQLFLELMAAAEQHGLGVFLLGASAESNAGACRQLIEKHPRLRIAGRRDGYFRDDDAVVEQINASGADMLFVALGSPRQEQWIAENRHAIRAAYCMGVGGTLDVLSGRVPWAPKLFRRTGTEFLYRLVREPRRWRRQIRLPWFVVQVLREAVLRPFAPGAASTSSAQRPIAPPTPPAERPAAASSPPRKAA